jgi:hypothetical protein
VVAASFWALFFMFTPCTEFQRQSQRVKFQAQLICESR